MKKTILIFALIFAVINLHSQGVKFNFAYGNNGLDEGVNVVQGADNEYYIIGSTSSSETGNTDILVLKIDSLGEEIWAKHYGTLQTDKGEDIVLTSDNNLLIMGYTNGIGNGGYDIYLAKISLEGEVIWTTTYGGSDWDFGYDLHSINGDQFLILGETYSEGAGNNDAYLLKINSEGAILWENTYGTEGQELGRNLDLSDNADILFIGDQKTVGTDYFHPWMVRLNQGGTILSEFEAVNDEQSDVFGQDIIFVGEDIIATSIEPDNLTNPHSNYWRQNNAYDYIWERTGDDAILSSLLRKNETAFVILGISNTENAYWYYLKQDSGWPAEDNDGPTEFDSDFHVDKLTGAINTSDGGFIAVGSTEINDFGQSSVLVIKFDSLLIAPQEIELVDLVLGVNSNSPKESIHLFPNPARDVLYLSYTGSTSLLRYNIINIIGDVMGSGEIQASGISIQDISDGVYFIELYSDGKLMDVQKFIKLK